MLEATVMNPDLVTNVCKSKNPVNMYTNAGNKQLDLDSDIPGFGVGKFDPEHMANIMGFSDMSDKHRITYDNSVEDAFNVHTENSIVKFK